MYIFPVLWEGLEALKSQQQQAHSVVIFQHKEPKLLGEKSNSSPGSGKIQNELEALVVPEEKKKEMH